MMQEATMILRLRRLPLGSGKARTLPGSAWPPGSCCPAACFFGGFSPACPDGCFPRWLSFAAGCAAGCGEKGALLDAEITPGCVASRDSVGLSRFAGRTGLYVGRRLLATEGLHDEGSVCCHGAGPR